MTPRTDSGPLAAASPAAVAWLTAHRKPYILLGRRCLLTPALAQALPERLRPTFD